MFVPGNNGDFGGCWHGSHYHMKGHTRYMCQSWVLLLVCKIYIRLLLFMVEVQWCQCSRACSWNCICEHFCSHTCTIWQQVNKSIFSQKHFACMLPLILFAKRYLDISTTSFQPTTCMDNCQCRAASWNEHWWQTPTNPFHTLTHLQPSCPASDHHLPIVYKYQMNSTWSYKTGRNFVSIHTYIYTHAHTYCTSYI